MIAARMNNKRILIMNVFFTLMIFLSCLAISLQIVSADDVIASGNCGEDISWSISDDNIGRVLTINGIGAMPDYKDKSAAPWNEGAPWYSYRNSITKVSVSEGITSIGDYAFDGFSSLKEILLPAGIQSVGEYAFRNSTSLSKLSFSEGLVRIEMFAFIGCTSLEAISLPSSLKTISSCAFKMCSQLEHITLPANLTTLSPEAFYSCGKLKSITIPGSLSIIETSTFRDCTSLEKVVIENGVKEIRAYAFGSCTSLKTIVFPVSVNNIFNNTFDSCDNYHFIVEKDSYSHKYAKLDEHCNFSFVDVSDAEISLLDSSYTYDGNEKCPDVNVEGLTADTDYTVEYMDNVNAGTATAIITGIGYRRGNKKVSFTIIPMDISGYEISLSNYQYLYDGEEKHPQVEIINLDNLEDGKDYQISYINNINEGTAIARVTGIGNYTGTIQKAFTIEKQDISGFEAVLSEDRILYDGEEKCPSVVVDGLVEGLDYTVIYSNNINAGKATVTISGIGKYKGSIVKSFVIWKEAYEVVVDGKIVGDYTVGSKVTITNDTEDCEYKRFSYWKIVSGDLSLSSNQLKKRTLTFTMPESDVKFASVYSGKSLEEELASEEKRHNAFALRVSAIESNIDLYIDEANSIKNRFGVSYLLSVSDYESKAASTLDTLNKRESYLAALRADTSSGHQVEIKRVEEEIDNLTAEYQMYLELKMAAQFVQKANDLMDELDNIDLDAEDRLHESNIAEICEAHGVVNASVAEIAYIRLDKEEYDYTGKEIHPMVSVIDANGKKLGSESYEVVYPTDSISAGTHTLTLNLKGKYIGTKKKNFTIAAHEWCDWVITKEPTCTEEGSRERTCSDCGKTVVESIEELGHCWASGYTVDKEPTCIEEGTKSIHCERCGEQKAITAIEKSSHAYGDWTITKEPNCTESGMKERSCKVCGYRDTEEIPIKHEYIEATTIKWPSCTESGTQEKECMICHVVVSEEIPAVGHIWSDTYTVDKAATYKTKGKKSIHCSVCNEIKPGSEVFIPKKDKIDLPKVTILKPVVAKKSATIKWKKISKKDLRKISKIQIQYSTDKTFKTGVKTVYVKKSLTSKKITKLIPKKKYYFRIRAYKKSGVVTHASKWSSVKYVKVK